MEKKQRRTYTPEEKVAILKKHWIDKSSALDLCNEYDLPLTVFYGWQKKIKKSWQRRKQASQKM